jgi:hypothetical protein
MLDAKALTHSRQETDTDEGINLRDLQKMKKEIKAESKLIKPMLVSEIKKGIWPMLKHSKRLRKLVMLKQKYLALLSSKYNLRSTQVESQMLE